MSITDSERISHSNCMKMAIHFNKLLSDLKINFKMYIEIFGDYNSENPIVANNPKSSTLQ